MDALAVFAARYSVHIALVVAAAAVASRALERSPAVWRLAAWRLVWLACLLLPLAPPAIVPLAASSGFSADVVASNSGLSPSGWLAHVSPWSIAGWLIAGGAVARVCWLAMGVARLARLRGATGALAVTSDLQHLVQQIAAGTELRDGRDVGQPVTFGLLRPIILLPRRFSALPGDVQRAVLCHELLHAARADWAWVLLEELVFSPFWFHPAIGYVRRRIQLAREETVDGQTAAMVGSRQVYVEALLAFAGEPTFAPAPPLARRSELMVRIMRLDKEGSMSRVRTSVALGALAVFVAGSAWAAASAMPLRTAVRYVSVDRQEPPPPPPPPPGPTNRSGAPRAIKKVQPVYPPEALAYGVEATITVSITIAAAGDVVDARTARWRLAFDRDVEDPNYFASHPERAFAAASEAAARLWTFAPADRDADAQLTFVFRTQAPVAAVVAPVAPAAQSHTLLAESASGTTRVVRVGATIAPPRQILDVKPVLPEAARAARVQGVVIADIRIGADGSVVDVVVRRSIPLLDDAAVAAIKQWRFVPTLLNGAPVEVQMTVPVNFTPD